MAAQELVFSRLGRTPEVPGPSDEAVVDAFAANLDLGRAQMHRIVTRDPEQLADADLAAFGSTREEAVAVAREVRSGLGPAYRRVHASSRPSHGGGVALAAPRVRTRARGAGRPAARRTGGATSSSGSGDDGSGPADPEPSSRPARRWALYPQSQPMGGRQRAVILQLDASATRRAEL